MKIDGGFTIFSIITIFGLVGCGSLNSENRDKSSSDTVIGGLSAETVDASSESYKVVDIKNNKTLQISLGREEKDVYLLFTNPTATKHGATVRHNQKRREAYSSHKGKLALGESVVDLMPAPRRVQDFNNQPLDLKKRTVDGQKRKLLKTLVDSEGDHETFYMNADSTGTTVSATARKVLSHINTKLGEKSLTVWVEDSAYYGSGCRKSKCVTDEMIDVLSNKFLKEGLDNDIYDWVTTVFGEEWGTSDYPSLIDKSDHISILLTDISEDNRKDGGVIGYFYSKDNFKRVDPYSGSNERIMFYIDSVMYANSTESLWSENDFWPQQIFSTLAHEFQHMIYFYQKNIKQKNQSTKTWINEMLSESTEDLVAVKMNVNGPRNVVASRGDAGEKSNVNGRYPLFNKNNKMSLTSWDNSLEDYSKVSSFGAYLLRNYGGAELLHDILASKLVNEEALMDAVNKQSNGVGKTFDDLIHDWGIAVLLSKRDDIARESGYLYNASDFMLSERNGIHYSLGSINFFNYTPNPMVESRMGKVDPQSNYYYKVGENLTGDITVDVADATGLKVSLVVVE